MTAHHVNTPCFLLRPKSMVIYVWVTVTPSDSTRVKTTVHAPDVTLHVRSATGHRMRNASIAMMDSLESVIMYVIHSATQRIHISKRVKEALMTIHVNVRTVNFEN